MPIVHDCKNPSLKNPSALSHGKLDCFPLFASVVLGETYIYPKTIEHAPSWPSRRQ